MQIREDFKMQIAHLIHAINNVPVVNEQQANTLDENGMTSMSRIAQMLKTLMTEWSKEAELNLNQGAIMISIMSHLLEIQDLMIKGNKFKCSIDKKNIDGKEYVKMELLIGEEEKISINFNEKGIRLRKPHHAGDNFLNTILQDSSFTVSEDYSRVRQNQVRHEIVFSEDGLWNKVTTTATLARPEPASEFGTNFGVVSIYQKTRQDGYINTETKLVSGSNPDYIFASGLNKNTVSADQIEIVCPEIRRYVELHYFSEDDFETICSIVFPEQWETAKKIVEQKKVK